MLQAIAAFICGHKTQAEPLFRLAKDELNKLKVPDEALEEVIAQGFSKTESRLALRACQSKCFTFKVRTLWSRINVQCGIIVEVILHRTF